MSAGREPWEDEPAWVGEDAGGGEEGGAAAAGDGAEVAHAGPRQEPAGGSAGVAGEPTLGEIRDLLRQVCGRIEGAAGGDGDALKAAVGKLARIAGALKKQGEESRAAAEEIAGAGEEDRKAWKAAAERVEEAVAGQAGDFARWAKAELRLTRWLPWAALAASVPAFLLLGMLAQKEFEVVPPHDPSGGWRGWIWEEHGPAIVQCAVEARRRGDAVECSFPVRGP